MEQSVFPDPSPNPLVLGVLQYGEPTEAPRELPTSKPLGKTDPADVRRAWLPACLLHLPPALHAAAAPPRGHSSRWARAPDAPPRAQPRLTHPPPPSAPLRF